MKKILFIIVLVFTIGRIHAQTANFDSLKSALTKKAPDDTSRFYILGELTSAYAEYKPDSCIYYARRGIDLGTKHNNAEMLAEFRGTLAFCLYIKGDYSVALDMALLSLQYYETSKDIRDLASLYNVTGNIYKGQENYPKAITYYKHCLRAAASVNDFFDMSYSAANLATVFEHTNVLDSALYYASKAAVYCRRNHNFYIEYVLNIYGDIYIKLNDYKKAFGFLQKSYALAVQTKNIRNQSLAAISLSKYYKQVNNADSAIYWAQAALAIGRFLIENKTIYQSAGLLSGLYESKHKTDSAFKYLKLSSTIRDSLYSTATFQAIDALNAGEVRRNEEIADAKAAYQTNLKMYALLFVIAIVLLVAFLLWRNSRNKQKANHLLHEQKEEISAQRDQLSETLNELKTAQTQLIQSEKMASLGELTAGIAHEIQNPLNFVNNFSEVSAELLQELKDEVKAGHTDDVIAIADDLTQNLEKINHHGKRADAIVKAMLEHSKIGSGEKVPTDINALADEFLKLSYHGLRAKEKSFNAELITHFDLHLPKVNIVQQDIGRVLLNLFNNAFYAVNQRQKTAGADYKPEVILSTSAEKNNLIIIVKDNGKGIPDAIKDKIMQPFFTTKPTGEGTGLGLSLSYDIIVKGHGGSITVETKEGEGAEFTVQLPAII
jgi:two-component system NtrC family sensor kinase